MSDLVSVRSTELNQGRSLSLAILLTVVVATLIFILSKAFLIDQDFIGSIYENGIPRALAGFFLLAFPYIQQRLAGKRRNSFSHLPDGAVSFEAYTLPWYMLLAHGVLIPLAIAGIGLFLVWLVGMVTGVFVTQAVSILNLILLFIAFYYLGFWIGSRSASSPYLTAWGMVLGYTILELVLTTALNIDSPLRGMLGLVIFLVLALVGALTGARTGKRRRISNYVHFLLAPLHERDRQTIVDNLYRDIKQHRMSHQPSSGETPFQKKTPSG